MSICSGIAPPLKGLLRTLPLLSCSIICLLLFWHFFFFFFGLRLNEYSVNIANVRFSSLIGQDLLSCQFIPLIATLIVLQILFPLPPAISIFFKSSSSSGSNRDWWSGLWYNHSTNPTHLVSYWSRELSATIFCIMVSSSTLFCARTKSSSLPVAATAAVNFFVVGFVVGGGAIVIWVSSFRGAATITPLPPLPPWPCPPVSLFRVVAIIPPLPLLPPRPQPPATRPLPLPLLVTATIVCDGVLLQGGRLR